MHSEETIKIRASVTPLRVGTYVVKVPCKLNEQEDNLAWFQLTASVIVRNLRLIISTKFPCIEVETTSIDCGIIEPGKLCLKSIELYNTHSVSLNWEAYFLQKVTMTYADFMKRCRKKGFT